MSCGLMLQECGMSLCALYNMVQCDCPGENKTEKCHMCCQQRGNHSVPPQENVFTAPIKLDA